MDRHDVSWRGYFTATPTPFTPDGDLDLDLFPALLQYFLDEGAHGVVVNGSSGEWYAQSLEERREVAAVAVRHVDGAVPVIIGVSSVHPHESMALMRNAEEIGADGVMLSPPAGWRLNRDEVLAFYRRTCCATALPVMLYNIPPDVSTDLKPTTILALSEIPNVVAVKDSTRDDLQFYETIEVAGDRIRTFGNVLTRAGIGLLRDGWGADGYVGSAMPFGRALAQAFEAVWDGRMEEARDVADQLTALQAALNIEDGNGVYGGIPGQMKAILNLLGHPAGVPRFPRLPVDANSEALDGLRKVLRDHGMEPVG